MFTDYLNNYTKSKMFVYGKGNKTSKGPAVQAGEFEFRSQHPPTKPDMVVIPGLGAETGGY